MKFLMALLAAALAGVAVPRSAPAQDPPPQDGDPSEKKKQQREDEAAGILERAKEFYKGGKFQEAQDGFRLLRHRYLQTRAYIDNSEEIETMINDCGYKVAATGLGTVKINKKMPHVDTLLGFQFFAPEGWRGIPNWQKLFGQADTSEADWRGHSYRVARYTSRWMESLHFMAYKTYAPNDINEVIEGEEKTWTRYPFETMKDVVSEDFPTPFHKNVKRVQKKDDDGNRMVIYAFLENRKGFGLVGFWRNSEDEFLRFRRKESKSTSRGASDQEWSAALKLFDQVAKTFVIMDQPTLAGMRGAAKSWGISPDGWCVRCVDWGVLTSPSGQYLIEYATRKEFAEKLAKEVDQIFRLYKVTIPTGKNPPRCRIKLFDEEEDFQYYGQAYGAAAYWSPAQEEIVAYRFEGREVTLDSKETMTIAEERTPEQTTFSILYHECFHQYMFYLMGRDRDVYVPSWLNEGMGDYFFGGHWEKGKFAIGPNEWRMATIVAAVKTGKHVPLERIIRYTQQDYYSNPGLCYSEGWSINYFFMSVDGKKKGYDKIPSVMYTNLLKAGDWKRSTDTAFGGIDLKKLEEEWKAFVLGLEKLVPKEAMERAMRMFGSEKKDDPGKKDGE